MSRRFALVAATVLALVVQALALVGLSATPAAAVDPLGLEAGDLVIADSGHDQVIVVPADGSPDRVLTTEVSSPQGVVVTPGGDVVVADQGNNRVIKVLADGSGIEVLKTGAWSVDQVELDTLGQVLFTGFGYGGIGRVTLAGQVRSDFGIDAPGMSGLGIGSDGDVVFAEFGEGVHRMEADGSNIRTVPGLPPPGDPIAFNYRGLDVDASDHIYVVETNSDALWVSDGAADATALTTDLEEPNDVALRLDGTAVVADTFDNRVVTVSPAGVVTPVATDAALLVPGGVAIVPVPPAQTGDIFTGMDDGSVVRTHADGSGEVTVATGLGTITDLVVDDGGTAYVSTASGDVYAIDPVTAGLLTVIAGSPAVLALAIGPDDSLYLTEDMVGIKRYTAASGLESVFAHSGSLPGLVVDAGGDIFVATSTALWQLVSGALEPVTSASFTSIEGISWFPNDGGLLEVADHGADQLVDVEVATGDSQSASYPGISDVAQMRLGTKITSTVDGEVAADAWLPRPSYTAAGPVPGSGNVDAAYAGYDFDADDRDGGDVSFRLYSGTLPPGLWVDWSTGSLSGTPTATGTYDFRVLAHNMGRGVVSDPLEIVVGKRLQTITFTSSVPSSSVRVPDGTYIPTATGGDSGEPVVFSIDPASSTVCSYDSDTGKVTFLTGGTCTVQADQDGDDDYEAAPTKVQDLSLGRLTQSAPTYTETLPTGVRVGDTYTPTANVSGPGTPAEFETTFVFSESFDPRCEYDSATGKITFTHAGTCRLRPYRPQSDRYNSVVAARYTNITVLPALLTFADDAPDEVHLGDTYTPTTNYPDSYFPYFDVDPSSDPGVCSFDGTDYHFDAPGTCVIYVDTFGNEDYTPTQLTKTIEILKTAQTVTFTSTAPTSAVVGDGYTPAATGGASGNPVTFAIAAASSGVCSISGGDVSFDHAGDCVVRAEQEGDATYADGLATQTITVGKLAQTVSFTSTAPTDAVVGETYDPVAAATSGGTVALTVAPASSGVCTISSGTVSFEHVGDCVVQADQAGTDDHLPATTEAQTITVGRGAQTVTFTSTPPLGSLAGDLYVVAATATSGGAVAFSVDPASASVCSVSGSTVSLAHVGSCVVHADQPGNADYFAASTQTQTIAVGRRSGEVWFVSAAPDDLVVGQTYRPRTGSRPGGDVAVVVAPDSVGVCSIDGGLVTLDHAGTCTLRAAIQEGPDTTPAVAEQEIEVGQADTEVELTVTPRDLTALVSVVEPGGGEPDGEVEFTVDGELLGTAELDENDDGDLVAVLDEVVETGGLRAVVATYTGSDDYEESEDTLERDDPAITWKASSAKPKRHGWYRSAVTLRFTCTTTTADLVDGCPAPVVLSRNRDGWQSVLREVTAADGGRARVVVTGIRIDHARPVLKVKGAKKGKTYDRVRKLRCVARDPLSGVATCKVRSTRRGDTVVYRAVAFDRAGNRTVVRGRYFLR